MNIAFVPIRSGSKSIPLKNIKEFYGKPLVYWVLNALQNAKEIDIVYIAIDSEQIKKKVQEFGFSKVQIYDRDPENATDNASSESVMLEFINKNNFNNNDLFVLAQATSPLTQSKHFDNAIKKLKKENADSLVTGVRNKRFFWDENGTPINYDHANRPRRQDFSGMIMENGAFYISKIENLKRYPKTRLSGKITIYEMEEYTGVEIDEEHDWLIAEILMQKYILNIQK